MPPTLLFLDDERPAPAGWTPVRWPDEVLARIRAGGVAAVSVDHDLGDDARGTGYALVAALEAALFLEDLIPPRLTIHSQNPVGRANIEAALASMRRRLAALGWDAAAIEARLPRQAFQELPAPATV